jgi:hypothetical protein
VVIRPPYADEREYILRSWIESYRYAPGQRKRRWRDYEAEREREFNEILDRRDTIVLVKALEDGEDDVILGWMCFARGTHADAVHWIFSRYRASPTGVIWRHRGTMRDLVEAARLKPHVAYTFRGALPRIKAEPRVSSDEWIVPWLMRRGIGAAYLPYKEWSGR